MEKMTWRQRLAEVTDHFEGGMKGLSLAAGLSETKVRDVIRRGHSPSVESFLAICEAAKVDPNYILFGDEPPRVEVPVVGIASAGEGWTPIINESEHIEFALSNEDMITIEIRGDSMSPVYRSGDKLICRRHLRAFDNLIGLDCAVLTEDGQGYVKILRRGTRPNRYNLKSYNVAQEDIENVKLAWAAPVVWIKRSGS